MSSLDSLRCSHHLVQLLPSLPARARQNTRTRVIGYFLVLMLFSCSSPFPVAALIIFLIVALPPIGERSIVISVTVCPCVSVCPRSYLRNYTSDLHQIFVRVTCDRVSVFLWRQIDTYVMYFRFYGRLHICS